MLMNPASISFWIFAAMSGLDKWLGGGGGRVYKGITRLARTETLKQTCMV